MTKHQTTITRIDGAERGDGLHRVDCSVCGHVGYGYGYNYTLGVAHDHTDTWARLTAKAGAR